MGKLIDIVTRLLLILSVCSLSSSNSQQKRFCANEQCTAPISTGVTLLKYTADRIGLLSFPAKEQVEILSKAVDPKEDLLFVRIGTKTGFVSKHFIKELRVMTKAADLKTVLMGPILNSAEQIENSAANQNSPSNTLTNAELPAANLVNQNSNLDQTSSKLDPDKEANDVASNVVPAFKTLQNPEDGSTISKPIESSIENVLADAEIDNKTENQSNNETNASAANTAASVEEIIPPAVANIKEPDNSTNEAAVPAPTVPEPIKKETVLEDSTEENDVSDEDLSSETVSDQIDEENQSEKTFAELIIENVSLPEATNQSVANKINSNPETLPSVNSSADRKADETKLENTIDDVGSSSGAVDTSSEIQTESKEDTSVENLSSGTAAGTATENQLENASVEIDTEQVALPDATNQSVSTDINSKPETLAFDDNSVGVNTDQTKPDNTSEQAVNNSTEPTVSTDNVDTQSQIDVQDKQDIAASSQSAFIQPNIIPDSVVQPQIELDSTKVDVPVTVIPSVTITDFPVPPNTKVDVPVTVIPPVTVTDFPVPPNTLFTDEIRKETTNQPLTEDLDTPVEPDNSQEQIAQGGRMAWGAFNSALFKKHANHDHGHAHDDQKPGHEQDHHDHDHIHDHNNHGHTHEKLEQFQEQLHPSTDSEMTTTEMPMQAQQLNNMVPTLTAPAESMLDIPIPSMDAQNVPDSKPIVNELPTQINPDTNPVLIGTGSVEEIQPKQPSNNMQEASASVTEPPSFFANIFSNIFGDSDKKEELPSQEDNSEQILRAQEAIERVLYPERFLHQHEHDTKATPHNANCDSLSVDSGSCNRENSNNHHADGIANDGALGIKHPMVNHLTAAASDMGQLFASLKKNSTEEYTKLIVDGLIEMSDLLMCLAIAAITVLMFIFGHYSIEKYRREAPLLSKMNILERSLMVSTKECALVKGELLDTKNKLACIEDNSFGSNEMVIALKQQIDQCELVKLQLQEQILSLEKELENAAEAGLELNKMVSELLSNQHGSDSIISSVEELQLQLNEQQATILAINTTLAEKSKENSELQILVANQNNKFGQDFEELEDAYKELKAEHSKQETDTLEMQKELNQTVADLQKENEQVSSRSKHELASLKSRVESREKSLQESESRVQALEETLKAIKKDSKIDFKEVMNVTNIKTDLLATQKERDLLKDRLEEEADARKLLEDHVKIVSEEVSSLRQEYNLVEKDKLEAQTRLEVLSGYFKDKETQLQKELSVKEAMWMQQQGETTSTVEKIRTMKDEIQMLKSQNDALKAEIEAQAAAHKAQATVLENRANDWWLANRQTERKVEEMRIEAASLRRKITSMAESTGLDKNLNNRHTLDGGPLNEMGVPSPIRMESPSSPMLGVLPPPPFLPPPFMPAPPFIPPPYVPGDMRPPPLGRLMSPPPPPNRYSPNPMDDHRDRYTPDRGRYTPDSRYGGYRGGGGRMSQYETETDISPPPSPDHGPRSGYRDRGYKDYKAYSPPPNTASMAPTAEKKGKRFKGQPNSGSADSIGPRKNGKV